MFRQFIKYFLRTNGFEICRISKDDRQLSTRPGWQNLTYKELQIVRAITYTGHISIEESQFLAQLVKRTSFTDPIIEIGTLFGFSTNVLAISKHKSQKLITVDKYIWNPHGITSDAHKLATFETLVDARENHNLEVICQDKDEFYKLYDGPTPGLFFCDAHHDYEPTKKDLQWAMDVGAKIICGHDFDPTHFPGVVKAVNELGGPSEVVGTLFVL